MTKLRNVDDEETLSTTFTEDEETITVNLKKGKESIEVMNPLKSIGLGDSVHRLQSHPVNDTMPDLKTDTLYYTVTSFEVVQQKFNEDRSGVIFKGANPGEDAEILFDDTRRSRRTDKYYVNREKAVQAAKDLTEAELDRAEEQFKQYQEVVNLLKENLSKLRF